MNNFRTLRANEIECRVGTCTDKGLSLLLYKDARCDQNLLDETVGPMNWMRQHSRDNANCTVSIWDSEKGQWISKEDTGTESNTEAEKGLASDSFKRACVNWGIGRELYTAPFIWISSTECNIAPNRQGKPSCNDKFIVTDIAYNDSREISRLEIRNTKTKKTCFSFGANKSAQPETPPSPPPAPVQLPARKTPAADAINCEKCGKALQPYAGKNNKLITPDAHAAISKARFGKVVCIDCINAEKEE